MESREEIKEKLINDSDICAYKVWWEERWVLIQPEGLDQYFHVELACKLVLKEGIKS